MLHLVDQHAAQHFLQPRAVLLEKAEKERGESSVQETGWSKGEVGSGLTAMLCAGPAAITLLLSYFLKVPVDGWDS